MGLENSLLIRIAFRTYWFYLRRSLGETPIFENELSNEDEVEEESFLSILKITKRCVCLFRSRGFL